MDYLDPHKRRRHSIRLMVGYVVLGVAILIGTTILLYQANGFDVRQGKVFQNGLVFVSSKPGGADVRLDGQKRATTGARLVLPAGSYQMKLDRKGYRSWQRPVSLQGNSVQRLDYPMLVPATLQTATLADYTAAPALSLQTPDRRWLLVQQPGKTVDFDMYDLRDPKRIAANRRTVSLPADLLTAPAADSRLTLVEASNDNRHFLLLHTTAGQREYISFDRVAPDQSRNLTATLGLPAAASISLQNKKSDRYFVLDPTDGGKLSTAQTGRPAASVATDVLAYKTYGDDVVLYARPSAVNPAKVDIVLSEKGQAQVLRSVAAQPDSRYLLDLAKYDDSWYVAVSAPGENRVFIYKDPAAKLRDRPDAPLVPNQVLAVNAPVYLKFSANTRFIMAHGAPGAEPVASGGTPDGVRFALYDNEYAKTYAYTAPGPFDAGQTTAPWMDGHRLTFVSKGRFTAFDYDGINRQPLAPALPGNAYFDRDYDYQYALAPAADGTAKLTQTAMLTPDDL